VTEETPLPYAPLVFGSLAVTADPDGRFEVSVRSNEDASVSSGLPALQILDFNGEVTEVLTGTGQQIAEFAAAYDSELRVNAISRIKPENMCRTFSSDTGEEALRFPYTSRYSEQLEVTSANLNTLFSISGAPYPLSLFEASSVELPDGFYGFEWPLSHFVWIGSDGTERVSAAWKILGKQSQVEDRKSDVPWCAGAGGLDQCVPYSGDLNNRIFRQAVSTVTALSRAAVRAKAQGIWKPTGRLRIPFFKRAAQSLSKIRFILSQLLPNRFICPGAAPPQCVVATFPKAELMREFESMLTVKWPRGLLHLRKTFPKERQAFRNELARQPDKYASCSE